MTGPVWTYKPEQHKTAWRGKKRVIALGPTAQAIVREFLTTGPEDYLFSPRRAMAERAAQLRASRATKVQPSQQNRRKANPRKQPGDSYVTASYAAAIKIASRKADAAAKREAVARARELGQQPPDDDCVFVPHWSPNRLRLSYATTVRRQYGLEAAGAALGHSKMSATEVYAERDHALAERVAREIG